MSIPIDIEFWEVSTDEEFQSNGRVVLGYISAVYETDTNLTLKLFYKRANDGVWLESDEYTLDKDEKRFFQKLPPSLSVIDFYLHLYGTYEAECEITSCKVHFKPIAVGKYG